MSSGPEDYPLDPEPLSIQTFAGQLIGVTRPWRRPRKLDGLDITGPTGSSAVIMVTPTSVPDPSRVVNRTNRGDANTYTPNRVVMIPAGWFVVVAWTGGTGTQATGILYATELA